MTYQEKQEMKLERFQELALKNKQQSESVYNAGKRISDMIPFGQPVILNHHSTARHLRDLDRIHNSMRKSIELSEKSEYYKNKVENILNPKAISSDDENAIIKLETKKANLEKYRDEMKRINKEFKKTKDLAKIEMSEDLRKEALNNTRCWNGVYDNPFPSYCLTNLGGSIRAINKRIRHLNALGKVQESEEVINGITIKINKEDNRVQLLFPGKPEESVRDELKSNGFRWSPYNMAWQRQISSWAINIAKKIAGGKNDN